MELAIHVETLQTKNYQFKCEEIVTSSQKKWKLSQALLIAFGRKRYKRECRIKFKIFFQKEREKAEKNMFPRKRKTH